MKPRIRLTLPEWGTRIWLCSNSDGFGKGCTPAMAYEAWERYVRFYGKKGSR